MSSVSGRPGARTHWPPKSAIFTAPNNYNNLYCYLRMFVCLTLTFCLSAENERVMRFKKMVQNPCLSLQRRTSSSLRFLVVFMLLVMCSYIVQTKTRHLLVDTQPQLIDCILITILPYIVTCSFISLMYVCVLSAKFYRLN